MKPSPRVLSVSEPRDTWFCIAASAANCVGYVLATVPPTIIDPLLKHHVLFPERHYPLAWIIWLVALFTAVSTFSLTYYIRSRVGRLVTVTSLLILAYILTLPVLLPELPHGNVVGVGAIWLAVTCGWLLIRYFLFRTDSVALSLADKDVRLQFTSQHLDFAKLLFLGLFAGYFGLIVTWFHEVHLYNRAMVTDAGEAYLLNMKVGLDVAVISFFYFFGILFEIARQRRLLFLLLLETTEHGSQSKQPERSKKERAPL